MQRRDGNGITFSGTLANSKTALLAYATNTPHTADPSVRTRGTDKNVDLSHLKIIGAVVWVWRK